MAKSDLLELAGRVSDGEPVDWDVAERDSSDPAARRVVRNLKMVEGLSSFHRRWESGEATTETLGHEAGRTQDPRGGAGSGGSFLWGGLEVRELLGAGGFGEVYRAWDPKLQRDVALKLLKREHTDRAGFTASVLHEARLLARVAHPNVVTVHGADAHDGRVGLWMEMVRGRSLARWVQEHGRLGAREAAVLGVELCRALAAVHGAGLVHRDVKAGNVMREEGGRILLMDFGAGIDASSLEDGDISGTPRYIAPEVYAGSKASPRSDLYSLGVLLYHLVTGRYPIDAGTIVELRAKALQRESRLLRDERPDLPEPFVRIVERALAWNPEERFSTAGRMELALSGFLGAESAAAPSATAPGLKTAEPAVSARAEVAPAGRAPASGTRSRASLFAITAIAILALVLVAVWMTRWTGPPETTRGAAGNASVPADAPGDAPEDAPGGAPDGAAQGTVAGDLSHASYSVEASLWRVRPDDRRERLDSGSRIRLGDRLALQLHASAKLHVYVIDEDDQGSAYALFPLPGLEPRNPLAPGETHLLPGVDSDRKQVYWNVTSAGGREHVLILASPEPLVEFEAGMSRLDRPRPGATATPIPGDVMVRLRGIGGLVKSPTATPAREGATHLFDLAAKLAGGTEVVRGPWVRRIDLESAGGRE